MASKSCRERMINIRMSNLCEVRALSGHVCEGIDITNWTHHSTDKNQWNEMAPALAQDAFWNDLVLRCMADGTSLLL